MKFIKAKITAKYSNWRMINHYFQQDRICYQNGENIQFFIKKMFQFKIKNRNDKFLELTCKVLPL